MEYYFIDNNIGVKSKKNDIFIKIEVNKNNFDFILMYLNENKIMIDRDFIKNNITPNFTVELLYYVLCEFIKYDNYKLIKNGSQYIFDGYYSEPYEQGEIIHIHIILN